MTAATRTLALQLRTAPNVTPAMLCSAAAVIDALLDVIESSGTVKRPPASVLTPGLGPLRGLRYWHFKEWKNTSNVIAARGHEIAFETLNQYFPKDDQL